MKDRVGREIVVGDLILYGRYTGSLIAARVERVTKKEHPREKWRPRGPDDIVEWLGVRIVSNEYVRDPESMKWNVVVAASKRLITLRIPSRIVKVDERSFTDVERVLLGLFVKQSDAVTP